MDVLVTSRSLVERGEPVSLPKDVSHVLCAARTHARRLTVVLDEIEHLWLPL
jgi:hypothetical protein